MILRRKHLPPLAINLEARLLLLDDDTTAPITNMLDNQGHETDDPELAVFVVGGNDAHGWWALRVEDYELAPLN